MKAITFIAITLLTGAIAGTILGILNQGIVEPYIEQAIALENEKAAAEEGEIMDPIEFSNYRLWQRGGEIAAGTILGTSIAALFGIVFVYSRNSIPGSSNKKKALILAGVMWFVIFLVPALKYPANPPAVGDPETIYYRQSLYLAYLPISGFSALGVAFMYRKMKKEAIKSHKDSKMVIELPVVIYAVIMITAYLAMPPNPDTINAPMDLVTGFRIASGFTMTVFWGLLGIILGAFWDKTKPHEKAKIATV
ncbi:MAG: CbtA family protein [Thermoproteota archaeon]|nr:CbtA family protein [Thermoproteota archaeon]